MSVIQFACIHCGKEIEVDAEHAGHEVTCPYCIQVVVAPKHGDAPGSPPRARPAAQRPMNTAAVPNRPTVLGKVGFWLVIVALGITIAGGIATSKMLDRYAAMKGMSLEKSEDIVKVQQSLYEDVLSGKSGQSMVGLAFIGLSSCVATLALLAGAICCVVALALGHQPRRLPLVGAILGFGFLGVQMLALLSRLVG